MDETAGSPLNPPGEPEAERKSGKWTPGPWRVGTQHQILSTGGDNRSAGIASFNSWMGREEAEANARLIAAAPDLYDALKAAQECIVALTRALPQDERLADFCNVLDVAERADLLAAAALAKARGEAPMRSRVLSKEDVSGPLAKQEKAEEK